MSRTIAYVRGKSNEQLEVSLLMRIGGPRGRFTLRAETTFVDGEDEDHWVEIRDPAGDLVDEN